MLHGGGNTSVKTRMADVTGETLDVLCVKGSGWDMGTIEAPGLPAVRLAPLRELQGLQALSDEDMVNVQRANLLDSKAPNPSVETLLHAFLPHKFIDHTAFQRRAGADRPARRRRAGRRPLRQARGAGALRHAGLCAGQEDRRGRGRPIPTSKG